MRQTRSQTGSGKPQPSGVASIGPRDAEAVTISDEVGQEVRVLVVEDEPLVSMMLLDLVEDAGFTPAGRAASAQDALRLARAERPLIALVDVNLRGAREGLHVAAELSRLDIALIFISGHGGVAEWPEVRALAPVAVLQKPCLPARVIEALKTAAEAKRAMPQIIR